MLTRTWPYGTAKRVKVLAVEFAMANGRRVRVMACEELGDTSEAHIIVGDDGDDAAAGEFGMIVFRQGGPTGGYWRYEHG